MNKHFFNWLAILHVVLVASGCQFAGTDSQHVVSPHKPENFKDAVVRLLEIDALLTDQQNPLPTPRRFAILDSDSAESMDNRTSEFSEPVHQNLIQVRIDQEWNDLVRWLPMIAADSSLPKRNWDVINDLSKKLSELARQINAAEVEQFRLNYLGQAESLKPILMELEKQIEDYNHFSEKYPF